MGYCTQSGGFRGNPLISTALNRRYCTNSTVFRAFCSRKAQLPHGFRGCPEQLFRRALSPGAGTKSGYSGDGGLQDDVPRVTKNDLYPALFLYPGVYRPRLGRPLRRFRQAGRAKGGSSPHPVRVGRVKNSAASAPTSTTAAGNNSACPIARENPACRAAGSAPCPPVCASDDAGQLGRDPRLHEHRDPGAAEHRADLARRVVDARAGAGQPRRQVAGRGGGQRRPHARVGQPEQRDREQQVPDRDVRGHHRLSQNSATGQSSKPGGGE